MFEPALAPTFPPLLKGVALPAKTDPMHKAVAAASTAEVQPGQVHYSETDDAFRVALTLSPEEPLGLAVRVSFAVMLGLSDALGALAPPEVAVHFVWPGGIKINGGACGSLRMAASAEDPQAEPDWLIAAIELPVSPTRGESPGINRDATTLHDEGCGDVTVPALIESWSRHTLGWINRYLEDGFAPLHSAWRGKCDTIGENLPEPYVGLFVGLDENGGMLLRQESATRTIPLTTILGAG
jgi:biotin-(acetyl-CoA carboxylase) ligase